MALTRAKINNIDTSIDYITDPIVLINDKGTLANIDVGFVINRDGGFSANTAMYWNETTDRFTFAYTTSNGLTIANVAVSSYANIQALSYFGNLAGGTTGVTYITGHLIPTANITYDLGTPTARFRTAYFSANTIDIGGSQISVDPTNGFSFRVSGTGTPTYLASNGLVAGTSLSTSGTLSVGTNATVYGYLNIQGNIVGTSATLNNFNVNGNHIATGYINTSGNVMGAVGQFGAVNSTGNIITAGAIHNALQVNGNQNTTGYINAVGNVLGATGVFGTINTTGLINSAANIIATTFSGGQINLTSGVNAVGNVVAATGIFNYLDVNGNVDLGSITIPGAGHNIYGNVLQSGAGTVFFNTPGNLMAALGRFGQISSDGFINTSANVSAAVGRFGSVLSDGFINTSANVSAALHTGGSVVVTGVINTASNVLTSQITVFGNATIGAITTPGVVHDVVGNIRQSGAGTVFFNTPGNVMAAVGRFGSVLSDGYINTSGNISTAQLNAGQINTTGNIISTGAVHNALTVNGNESVTGYLNVTGNVMTAQLNAGQINTTGNVLATAGTFNAVTVNGNIGILGAWINAGTVNVTGNVLATQGSFGTINTTGFINSAGNVSAAVHTGGAVSVTGLINTTGNLSASTVNAATVNASGNVLANTVNAWGFNGIVQTASQPTISTVGNLTALSVSGATNLYNLTRVADTTNITYGVLNTGAFAVAGGMTVGKDVWVGGNLYVANILSQNTTILEVSAPLVYLETNVVYPYNYDIGFFSHFIGGTGNNYQHTGMVRNDQDSSWYLFSNVAEPSAGTVTFNANTVYDTLIAGTIRPGANLIHNLGNTLSYYGNAYINNLYSVSAWGTLQTAAQPNVTSVGVLTSLNTTGNILSTGAVHNALTVNGGITSTGFFNTTANISAATVLAGAVTSTGLINTTGNILSTGAVHNALTVNGNVTVGNLVSLIGSGQFNGPFNESTTAAGVYVGNLNLSPRIGFFNGTASQNWQIDNNFGTFRWYTPGVTRMTLDPNGNLSVTSATTINYTGSADSALQITGPAAKGGAGYHDFLRATNTGGTNPNKWFRINSTGALEIVNSAYSAVPFSLTDAGIMTISGNINAGTLATPGAQHTFWGNVQTNAIGFLQVPAGTTLQRPVTGNVAGMIRFNTDTNSFEGYSNVWAAIGSGGGGGGSTPGGVTSTLQYNNGGALGGIATLNYIVANSALILSTGTSSTSTATGALQVIGGIGVTGAVTAGQLNSTGNVLSGGGVFNALAVNGTATVQVLNSTGNVLSTGAVHNALTVNGNTTIGAITVAGGVHSVVGNVKQSGAGTIFFNTPGNIMAASGFFGSVTSTGVINTSGNVLSTGAIHNALTVNGVITSTQATGTAPFTVSSTTVVTNLNADLWDGNHFADYLNQAVKTTSTPTFSTVTATTFSGTLSGAAPAGSLSGTTLASGVTASSLTSVGTLTGLTVSGITNLGTGGATNYTRFGTSGVLLSTDTHICHNMYYNGAWAYLNVAVPSSSIRLGTSSSNQIDFLFAAAGSTTWSTGFSFTSAGVMTGTATSARYADLAEKYTSDQDYAPGTVVVFGGDAEVTISTMSHDSAIAGVVSTNPAHLMNDTVDGVAVALQGRVPCRVLGPVRKGDRVVASQHPGVAQKLNMMHYQPGCIIGKALENIEDSSIQLIEVVVGRV